MARVRAAVPEPGRRWLADYKFGSGALFFLIGVEAIRLMHADRLRYIQTLRRDRPRVAPRVVGMSLDSFA